MKKLLTVLVLCMASLAICAQSSEDVYDPLFVDVVPDFQGGQLQLYEWLSQNVQDSHVRKGRVVVKFVILEDGSIGNIEVVKHGASQEQDIEALRLISTMPRWVPAKKRGEAVKCYYTMPINFRPQYTISESNTTLSGVLPSGDLRWTLDKQTRTLSIQGNGEIFWCDAWEDVQHLKLGSEVSDTLMLHSCINRFKQITDISVDEGNFTYSSADGVLFDRAQRVLLLYPRMRKTNYYAVPESVKSIKLDAFYGAEIACLFISRNVTDIPRKAFYKSKIKSFEVADGNTGFISKDGWLCDRNFKNYFVLAAFREISASYFLDSIAEFPDGKIICKHSKPCILVYYYDGCKPAEDNLASLLSLVPKYKEQIDFCIMNTKNEENVDFIKQCGIVSVPVFWYIQPDYSSSERKIMICKRDCLSYVEEVILELFGIKNY